PPKNPQLPRFHPPPPTPKKHTPKPHKPPLPFFLFWVCVYSQVRGRGINPAMMGFMPSSGFGGMVDWGFGSFGIMAGMRRDYVPMHGRWEMRPIFAPYFGSGSRKFSIDLGSIFGGFISDMLESKASEISKPRPSNRSMPSVGSPGFVPPHRR
ncbi:MAG: hypothetical protein K2K27_04400, partial [Muribaculaceae bacterium]|nr:hypothetical protein [Muribaculaceae bacterium]